MATTLQALPQTVNLEIERGDDASFLLAVTNSAGAAMNLASCAIWWTLKDPYDTATDDSGATAQYVWKDGGPSSPQIVVSDLASGLATLTLPHALTATLKTSKGYVYKHDVQVLDADGVPTTTIIGTLIAQADVTRATTA